MLQDASPEHVFRLIWHSRRNDGVDSTPNIGKYYAGAEDACESEGGWSYIVYGVIIMNDIWEVVMGVRDELRRS